MNPRDTDVWGRPDGGGAERRLGIGGIRIPTVDLPRSASAPSSGPRSG